MYYKFQHSLYHRSWVFQFILDFLLPQIQVVRTWKDYAIIKMFPFPSISLILPWCYTIGKIFKICIKSCSCMYSLCFFPLRAYGKSHLFHSVTSALPQHLLLWPLIRSSQTIRNNSCLRPSLSGWVPEDSAAAEKQKNYLTVM